MADYRSFLTGLTSGATTGYQSARKRDEMSMADELMKMILKARIEQEFQDPYKRQADIAKARESEATATMFEQILKQGEGGGIAGFKPKGLKVGPYTLERDIPPEEILAQEEHKAQKEEASLKRKSLYGAENQNAIRKAMAQIGNVNIMTDKLFQMPAGRGQYATKVGAFVTGGKTPAQADIAEYEDFVQANAAGLYRDLTGDNRLSDQDAQNRAMPLIPRPQQDRRLQLQKTFKLNFMLRKRAEMLRTSTDEVDISELGRGYEKSPEYRNMLKKGKNFGITWGKQVGDFVGGSDLSSMSIEELRRIADAK